MSEIYLVTGANSGLGLDAVRRLAMKPSTKKVYMGCRSEKKARDAIESLKSIVDTSKLQYIHFDACATKEEIFKTGDSLDSGDRLTGLLLNAGGMGNDKTKNVVGPNQVVSVHQINLIGHIQLVEALSGSKMAPGCKIVYAGSEAARGIPLMMFPNPTMGDTKEWYESQLKGDYNGYNPSVSARLCACLQCFLSSTNISISPTACLCRNQGVCSPLFCRMGPPQSQL